MICRMIGGSLERRQILWAIILVMVMELPLRWIYHHNQLLEHAFTQDESSNRVEAMIANQSAPVLSALQDFASHSARRRHHYRKPKRVPIVGIFSQPYYDSSHEYHIPPNHTMIAASYVKWLEAGGATAIVIPYDASPQQINEIVDYVDGILFPGGDSALPPTAKQIWDLLYQPGGDGKAASFAKPLWGTCLGFEWILKLASGNSSILESDFVASNVSLPLEEVKQMELYTPSMMYDIVTQLPVTMNNHHQGISPQVFRATPSLVEHWDISSTNHDLSFHEESKAQQSLFRRLKDGESHGDDDHKNHGKQFVSTIEPKNPDSFPVYGVQWHPEKNAFEYATTTTTKTSMDRFPYEDIDHSAEAIAVTHHMSSFFVRVLHKHMQRKHAMALKSREADPDNYPSIYSYPIQLGKKFEQIFIIPPAD